MNMALVTFLSSFAAATEDKGSEPRLVELAEEIRSNTGGFSLVHNLWDQGFLCTKKNYALNEAMPHTLAIHYRVQFTLQSTDSLSSP